jgi:sugar-specific transcriptional regulator TrmB
MRQILSQAILEKLGLSPNEAKIYLSLLEYGERGVASISAEAGIHRRNVYDSLKRLLDKGLVQQFLDTKENRYAPVDPSKLSEIIAEQFQQLQEVMPVLAKQFTRSKPQQQAFILKGIEGMKIVWNMMLKEKKDIYSVGAKGQWFDPALTVARKRFLDALSKTNVAIYLLRDYNFVQQEKDFLKNFQFEKIKSRVLPKDYDTSSSINLCGDYVIQYNSVTILRLPVDTTFYVIKDRDLAESYHRWFEFMWQMSKEMK